MVRREKVGEVFLLIKRILIKNDREKGIKKGDRVWIDKNGDTHIRREAQNDDWY